MPRAKCKIEVRVAGQKKPVAVLPLTQQGYELAVRLATRAARRVSQPNAPPASVKVAVRCGRTSNLEVASCAGGDRCTKVVGTSFF